MILPRLLRTSSFRLTLLYAGLFGASVLILFGVTLWSMTGYMAGQLDETVANEIAEVQSDAGADGTAALAEVVGTLVRHTQPGVYYLMQTSGGAVAAGNLPAMAPEPGVRELAAPVHAEHRLGHGQWIRGTGVRTPDGGYLFVGVDSFQLHEMRETVIQSFLWMGGATVVLALLGGMIMSAGLLRRVQSISRSSQAIVSGDLSQRIAVRGTGDEFDHLANNLNTMLDRIQALMQGLSQVSSDIAHDLRTPLTRLRQRLELAAQRGRSPETVRDGLGRSIQDVDTILDTFGALLRIAQIEARVQMAAFSLVDLSALLQTLQEVYQPEAEANGQHIETRLDPGLRVQGDCELLTQLFVNLIENAIQHCPAGAAIILAARAVAGKIEVMISDNGPGIPADAHSKVLQRFYRLERSRSTTGTGLGLSLVTVVAGLHDARLTLSDNAPGLAVTLSFSSVRLTSAPRASTSHA